MTTHLDRKRAVEAFMHLLIPHARDGTIQDIISMLNQGPPGQEPPQDKLALHYWFQQLDNQSQEHVREIVRESVDSALFSTLVILDGAAGGWPVRDELSDFAIYLQTYQDSNAQVADSPQVSVRLNSTDATEDLHDIFRWTLEEHESS